MADDEPWFKDGLDFSCTQCGRCCSGPSPGMVWVSPEEIEAIAASLKLSVDKFGRKYLRRVGKRISLIEKPNHDCVFWDKSKGCQIYELRPSQCRQFPFWPELLESREAWNEEATRCPGLNSGKHYSLTEIRAIEAGFSDTGAQPVRGDSSSPLSV